MGLIQRFLIKRALKKTANKSELERVADEVLKNSMQELQQTNRTANKILQSKIIRQESQHALKKIQELDEELIEDEPEEAPSLEDNLGQMLMAKLMSGTQQTQTPTSSEITGYDDEGKPIQAQNPQTQIQEVASKLSPAQIQALKDKFLK